MYLWKTFLFFTFLAKFSSSCALAFPITSLLATSLYISQDIHLWFHCLCISCLHFSLVRKSLFNHAGLLPSFPDVMHRNWDLLHSRKYVFKERPALFSSFIPEGSCLGSPIHQFLEQLKVCSPNIQCPDSTLPLACIPQDCKVHLDTIIAAWAPANIDISI